MADLRELLKDLAGPTGSGTDANLHAWAGSSWAKVSGLAAFGTMKVHVQLIGAGGLPIANDGLQLSVAPTKDGANYRATDATITDTAETEFVNNSAGNFMHLTSVTIGNSSATPVVVSILRFSSGSGTRLIDIFSPAGSSITHFFGLWGIRGAVSESFTAQVSAAVTSIHIAGVAYFAST